MDTLTIAAASGLRSRMESLSLLANNLANAGTAGYKTDREFYGLYTSAEADAPEGEGVTLPTIQRQWTDFSQGTMQVTGNPLDVALSGSGFLVAKGTSGPLYTRNGNLHLSARGELTTPDGFPIMDANSNPIRVTTAEPVEIAIDGTVRQNGRDLGKIQIVDFKSTAPLEKLGGTSFRNTDPKNPPAPAGDTQLLQGKLEGSNVGVPESAMRLVGMMRQFEMLQKAVTMGVDMNAKAIQEVARVGG